MGYIKQTDNEISVVKNWEFVDLRVYDVKGVIPSTTSKGLRQFSFLLEGDKVSYPILKGDFWEKGESRLPQDTASSANYEMLRRKMASRMAVMPKAEPTAIPTPEGAVLALCLLYKGSHKNIIVDSEKVSSVICNKDGNYQIGKLPTEEEKILVLINNGINAGYVSWNGSIVKDEEVAKNFMFKWFYGVLPDYVEEL